MATNTEPVIESAQQFIRQLQAGEFEQAATRFDKTMGEMMPLEGLKAGWEQVQMQAGPFQEALDATAESQDGYQVVVIKLRFEKGNVACRLVFDQAGKVAGMGFAPA